MPTLPSFDQSYLLRFWRVKTNGEGWRVRLTHVDTGAQQIFTEMEALFAYLEEITQEKPESGTNFPTTNSAP